MGTRAVSEMHQHQNNEDFVRIGREKNVSIDVKRRLNELEKAVAMISD